MLIFIPVAQWTRARRYGRRFVAGSNPVGDAVGDYLSWLESRPDTSVVIGSNPISPIHGAL